MKTINPLFKAAVAILFVFSSSWCQTKMIQLSADFSAFRYDNRANFVEVYYSVQNAPQSVMKLSVLRNDTVWNENTWKNSQNDSTVKADIFIGRVYFLAPEGNYQWKIEVQNLMNGEKDSVLFHQKFQPFSSDPLQLSDIELASSIQFSSDSSGSNPFYKNSLIVIPNPSSEFGVRHTLLYYYVELYHLLSGIQEDEYQIKIGILDQDGKPVETFRPIIKKKKRANESLVDFGEIGLFGLGSGRYFLYYLLMNLQGNVLVEKQKTFWVYIPTSEKMIASIIPQEKSYEVSPFSGMDESTLKSEYEYARYLLTNPQRKMFSSIKNPDAKRKFMFDFWNKMANPAQSQAVTFEEYHRRIDEANESFHTLQMQGWKTDRGRVFMAYGKPNDVDRFPSTSQMVPYEIWNYDAIEGGVIFVFADLSGFKNYSLIHSTKRGEVNNPDYQRQLTSGF